MVCWSCQYIVIDMVIYKTTNKINGKIYIGKDARNRRTYLGSGLILRKAIIKYGRDNFSKEILEKCSTLEELSQKEIEWINKFKSNDPAIGYNLTSGGLGGDTYSNANSIEKERRKHILIEAARKFNNSVDGKKFLSDNSKKMWQKKSHQDLIRNKMLGRKILWKDKISSSIKKWHKTNPIPPESRQRASQIMKIKMSGYEFVIIPDDIKIKIKELYQSHGPTTIAKIISNEGYAISVYLIRRFLKKIGIYQKWKRGIKS